MWENLGEDMKDRVSPEVVEVNGNMEVYITGKDEACIARRGIPRRIRGARGGRREDGI